MNYLLIGQWTLVVMFVLSAGMKFARTKNMVQHWTEYRYPMGLMFLIASLELLGAAGIFASLWLPELLKVSALLLGGMMLGAIHAHLVRARHKPYMALNALFMLMIAAALFIS
ncbi:DoxX family protein [Paenibacillus sanfengchensis]|uniref:DoxX family protein n=1 Tax=Paenibacillus sanfengchensis TaxID=3119819 RepID=UPI002FE1DDDA